MLPGFAHRAALVDPPYITLSGVSVVASCCSLEAGSVGDAGEEIRATSGGFLATSNENLRGALPSLRTSGKAKTADASIQMSAGGVGGEGSKVVSTQRR